MSHTVTIYGASDDLIEIEGTAPGCDEYNSEAATFIVRGEQHDDLIAGRTRVTVAYVAPGVWSLDLAPVDDGIPMVPCVVDLSERYDGTPGYSARARFDGVERVEAPDV